MRMNEDAVFAQALESVFSADIAEYQSMPDHRFSRSFERRMKKLLKGGVPEAAVKGRRIPPRKLLLIAAIAVALAAVLMGATFAVYKLWDNYRVEDHSLYSMLYITDIENSPKMLYEYYRLGADMSEYEIKTVFADEYFKTVDYTKNNGDQIVVITFSQTTKEHSEQFFINTEDAIVMPTEIVINGCQGFFMEAYNNIKYVMWDNGDYIMHIDASGISKNELITLAESVEKDTTPKVPDNMYGISADMSDYEKTVVFESEYRNITEYKKPDTEPAVTVTMYQTQEEFAPIAVVLSENQEEVEPVEININGHDGWLYVGSADHSCLRLDMGEVYVDLYADGISKDELILLAESVQKVE